MNSYLFQKKYPNICKEYIARPGSTPEGLSEWIRFLLKHTEGENVLHFLEEQSKIAMNELNRLKKYE